MYINFSSKHTNRDHWDEVGVLVLERDEPPVTVVIALARVAVGRRKIIPRVPNLSEQLIFITSLLSFRRKTKKPPSLNFVGVGIDVGESVVAMSAQGRVDVIHIKLAESGPKKQVNYCTFRTRGWPL